jgi:hypothetical protein
VEHRPARRDRAPDRTQRLLNHASWDTLAATAVARHAPRNGTAWDITLASRAPGGP